MKKITYFEYIHQLILCAATGLTLLSSYPKFYNIPLWSMLWVLVFMSLVLNYRKFNWSISKNTALILILTLALFSWILSVECFKNCLNDKLIFTILVQLLILLSVYFSFSNFERVKLFIYFLIVVVSFSCLIGILQYFDNRSAIDLWYLCRGQYLIPETRLHVLTNEKIAGLSGFSIRLGYLLSAIVPFLFVVMTKKDNGFNNKFLYFGFVITSLALVLTFSRSAILGVLLSILILVLKSRKYVLKRVVYFCVIALFLYGSLGVCINKHLIDFQDNSSFSRIPILFTALNISYDNPQGIGTGQTKQYASKYLYKVKSFNVDNYILQKDPHDQFLNMLVFYGFPGLVLILIFYFLLFRNLFKMDFNDPSKNAIRDGLLALHLGYIINSLFHNDGPFLGDSIYWMFIGLTIAFCNYCEIKKIKNL